MNYQLFADGTMNILVDGKVQRRSYSFDRCAIGGMEQIEPELREGEEVIRTLGGDISIITIEEPRV